MIGKGSFKVRDGKSGKIHKMVRKFNGDILNYQQKKIQKMLQGLTYENISEKSQLKHSLNSLKYEIELFQKLQKYYKRDGTTKISENLIEEIMRLEIIGYLNCLVIDYKDERLNKTHFDVFPFPEFC